MLDLTRLLISISPRFRGYFDKVLFGLPRLIRWARKKRFISEVVVMLEILVVMSLMYDSAPGPKHFLLGTGEALVHFHKTLCHLIEI